MKGFISNSKEHYKEIELAFSKDCGGEMQEVKVYPQITFQEVLGIGGALTEAAAYVYSQMDEKGKEELIELYFGENGNKYNFCRLHIQSCDFGLGNYSYVEDENDKELNTFSIDRDRKYIIPLIKAALAKNPDIAFLASPWSPAPFMKTNNEMNNGGKLKPEFYSMWADMICRYVMEYEKEGIIIRRLTVQNEPAAVQTWDSCIYSATEEAEFVVKYLKPALAKAGYGDIKISIWDHNKEIMIERAMESFAVEGADEAIDGVAFHWYAGDHFEALAETRRMYPDKELIFTEGCVEYSRFAGESNIVFAEMYAHDMIGDFLGGANAFIDWNIYLDEKGGPNHVNNFCDAPVMCDAKTGTIDVKNSYYFIGHLSRFVKPGAERMLVSKYNARLECVGFVNPDGQKILVVLNRTDDEVPFSIYEGVEGASTVLGAHSMATFCW